MLGIYLDGQHFRLSVLYKQTGESGVNNLQASSIYIDEHSIFDGTLLQKPKESPPPH